MDAVPQFFPRDVDGGCSHVSGKQSFHRGDRKVNDDGCDTNQHAGQFLFKAEWKNEQPNLFLSERKQSYAGRPNKNKAGQFLQEKEGGRYGPAV